MKLANYQNNAMSEIKEVKRNSQCKDDGQDQGSHTDRIFKIKIGHCILLMNKNICPDDDLLDRMIIIPKNIFVRWLCIRYNLDFENFVRMRSLTRTHIGNGMEKDRCWKFGNKSFRMISRSSFGKIKKTIRSRVLKQKSFQLSFENPQ